ncbi:MAG: hypothetical protein LBC37_05910 [Zoogloeaceae bacterium]|jgi:general secretion pathway protein D|nr:hypothetical protein [Zoogloeaceae bacterium]
MLDKQDRRLWFSILLAALAFCALTTPIPAEAADAPPAVEEKTAGETPENTAEKTPDAPAKKGGLPGKGGKKADAPGDLYLRQITLDEAAQIIAQVGRTSVVVSASVANRVVSLYLREAKVEHMVKNLCRAAGIWYRHDQETQTWILMSAKEFQEDLVIARDEVTRVWTLRHHNVVSLANAVRALLGARVALVEPVEERAPESMGSTARMGGGGARSSFGDGTERSIGASRSVTRGGGGSQADYDARKNLEKISQAALTAATGAEDGNTEGLAAVDLQRAASAQGLPITVTYNRMHNLLIVRSSDERALADIDTLIGEMDKPPRQVLLEMKIMEVELGDEFRSVFDFGTSGRTTSSGPLGLGTLPQDIVEPGGSTARRSGFIGGFGVEEGASAVWQFVNDRLWARLQLLEGQNRVNVLATPMLIAANDQPARLFIGDEQVLVTGASANSYTGTTGASAATITVETEQRNVGQTLIVLPRINADRSVTLTIDQDNSRVSSGAATLPLAMPDGNIYQFPIDTVNTANLQVTAHARDGLTVAIGGMIRQRVSDAETKVPLLGDLPLLGMLFRKTARANTRSQLLLLITPHVLETPEEGAALAAEKTEETSRLNAARRPHADIFQEAPRNGYSSPLLENLGFSREFSREKETP